MSIKRFFAKTTSEALRKVRDALGPEGVILSNRSMDGGIEILALRQDDITALIPASEPQDIGVGRFQAGPASLSHVLSGKQAKANEGEMNPRKPGYEVQAFSPAGPRDLLNRIKKVEMADKDLHSSGNPFRQSGGQKREPECEAGLNSGLAELDWASHVAANASTELKEFNQAIKAVQIKTKESVTRASRFAQNSHQPAGDTADYIANQKADGVADHIADQLGRNKESEAAIPGKRPRDSRRIAAGTPPDTTTISKRKPKQLSEVDTRQLAAEVASSVLKEIRSMRSTLEQQFFSLNWNGHERGGPHRGHLLSNLLAAGFSASLAKGLMEQLPDHPVDGNSEEDPMKYIRTALIRNLKTIRNEDEILEKGGIYALVGPTGVGKTTTTAKLAARCVVRHGANKLALLTTDGYRIGGHEQLRIYGKILGVTVYAVKDAQDLALALAELRGKHMVLIDTVGVGQRDQMVAEQVAMFAGCGTEVKRLLLLNASSNLHTLDEVAEAYGGGGLAGAIITKLDEAVIIGSALDTAIRHHLPLYYVAQGQRVPEDLELADPRRLVNLALDNSPASSHFGLADAFPLMMTQGKAINMPLNMDGVHLD
jgi:flagellar biosynthesis protein FlhF